VTSIGVWLAAHADLDRRDREVLLCAAAGLSRAEILSHPERPLTPAAERRLEAWAARRRDGEPLAYLTGRKEFWGLELEVTPDVLVPRPETELLVEQALELAEPARARPVTILELGTGSGGVAIAIAREAANQGLVVEVTASDVSPDALAVAMRNGQRLQADVRFRASDWYEGIAERFHLIVSNPPYVAEGDPHLEALRHEPHLALTAGAGGLDALRAIVSGAPSHLHPGGWLVLEHGCDQGPDVRALLTDAGFTSVATLPDLAGLDRVTRGTVESRP
jgi:release factor glutamine methyltransferase